MWMSTGSAVILRVVGGRLLKMSGFPVFFISHKRSDIFRRVGLVCLAGKYDIARGDFSFASFSLVEQRK